MPRIKVTDSQLVSKYVSLQSSAIGRGLDFNLSLRRLRQLMMTETCFYTGIKFNTLQGGRHTRTIDRVDSSRGYVDDNVVACTAESNSFKDKFDLPLMLMMVRKLLRLNRNLKTGTRTRSRKVVL